MDKEQEEMQFLGVLGIYAEASKIIFSWRKIFTQITLAFIFPLIFIYLAQIEVSHILFGKIIHNETVLGETRAGTSRYDKVSNLVHSERTTLALFKIAYLIFFLILSLLSTSAVVYTIACIYTGKEITFKKVVTVVPKVWKRLMVTFVSIFFAIFAYNLAAVSFFILYALLTALNSNFDKAFVFVLVGVYLVGFVYMSFIWYLSSVVSVLEDARGFSAMKKSKDLLRGKMWVAWIVFSKLNLLFFIGQLVFEKLVVYRKSVNIATQVVFGILCMLLLVLLMLFGLVVQTVVYFVCKSYHHENIDKSALSDHLEVYLGEYIPLKAQDVQLEQFEV